MKVLLPKNKKEMDALEKHLELLSKMIPILHNLHREAWGQKIKVMNIMRRVEAMKNAEKGDN